VRLRRPRAAAADGGFGHHDGRAALPTEGNCPYEANVGVEFKGVRGGVERRRGVSGL
jgi:hypothetical protein